MNKQNNQIGGNFISRWILANFIGWLVGFIATFILSYLVVNLFYPKETNLILGLCTGASVGYAQWYVLKSRIEISSLWGLVCTVCLGIPFIIEVIIAETGFRIHLFQGSDELLVRLFFGIAAGLVIGLFQMQLLRPHFNKAALWIPACSIGWGACFLASSMPMPFSMIGVIAGGGILGAITGYGIIWMTKSTD